MFENLSYKELKNLRYRLQKEKNFVQADLVSRQLNALKKKSKVTNTLSIDKHL